ncbi:hypothetical protein ACFV0D_40770, partial [Streptomyces sp. NPDC059556]
AAPGTWDRPARPPPRGRPPAAPAPPPGRPETDAYTPMVAVATATEARACGRLADGGEGCTAGP